jgi:hypothetical protein
MQRLLHIIAAIGLLAAVMAGGRAAAAEGPWDSPAMSLPPEALLHAAGKMPTAKDSDIEMLFEEHSYKLDAEGRQNRTVRRVFRYLTDKGLEDWAYTEADWLPWCEEKPAIRARVVTPDGHAHALDPESIGEAAVDQGDPNLLSDQKQFRAPLPAIEIGAIVEEQIETHETRPFFDHGIVERVLSSDNYPIHAFRMSVDAPASLPLHCEVLGDAPKPIRTESSGRVVLHFAAGPIPKRKHIEPYLPAADFHSPEIAFSTGKSWADVATAYSAIVEKQLDLDAVKSLVHDTLGGETDRDKIVARLLAALRTQVRYTGIEFGKGAIVPRTCRDTLTRRYGDCKDQSALLVAMLRIAGIKAQVALLKSSRVADVIPGLPGLGDFDHAIVFLPGDRPMWVDPSARCVPAGQLPLGDQGRWSLLADAATRELVRTPGMDYRLNTSHETFDIFLTEHGKARVRVTAAAGGSCDEDLRENYASSSVKELRKAWRDFFKEQYHTQSLARLEYAAPLDLSKPFRVVAEVSDARLGQFQDTEGTVSLLPDPLFDRLPDLFKGVESDKDEDDAKDNAAVKNDGPAKDDEKADAPPAERQSPLVLPEPHIRELQFRVTPPPGFVPRALPEDSVKQFGQATISQHFERTAENVIVATFRLDTGPGRFTAAEVNALCQGIADLGVNGDDVPWEVKIALDHVAARHLAAGRVREAVAECRELVAKHPEQAEQHQRFAQILLKAGLGEAARAEARRGVELAPRSAAAHASLARVLTYDLLGRHFRPGMDWPGAVAGYRKALELDPADVATRMDLAILLEHNESGIRYASRSRLDEAVAEYRKAQKQLGSHNRLEQLDVNLALALLFSERFADLEKLARRSEMSATWKSLAVAAVAAQRGAAEAQQKAAELSRGADDRRSVLEGAAEYLQETRLYPAAAALLEAAAAGSSDPGDLHDRAKSIASFHRVAENDASQAGPRRVVQQLFLALLEGETQPQRIAPLVARSVPPQDMTPVLDQMRQALRSVIENQRQNQVPSQQIADVLALLDVRVEGDDAGGYRLTVNDEDMKDLVWYVLFEDGAYRFVPPGPDDSNLEAVARAQSAAGRLEAAKRWRQWAAEKHAAAAGSKDAFAAMPPDEKLAIEAMRAGDFDTVEKRLRPLAAGDNASPAVLNNLAWNALLQGNTGSRALDDATDAAVKTSYQNSACLNTLAAVQAEQGKTAEALENLRRSVELRGDEVKEVDWYVLGRLAEHDGLDDVAAALYGKITCPKRSSADDAYHLAQRRLKKLGKG